MDNKYLDVTNLPWDKNVSKNSSIYDYLEIKNKDEDDPQDAMIYYFTANKETIMKGEGVLEMQAKLAHVFRHRQFDIYKKYFIDDESYRNALTSGIYGPKTAELVMVFQKIYLNKHFKGNWDPKVGFGAFGGHTKKKLEQIFQKLRREISKQRRTQRPE